MWLQNCKWFGESRTFRSPEPDHLLSKILYMEVSITWELKTDWRGVVSWWMEFEHSRYYSKRMMLPGTEKCIYRVDHRSWCCSHPSKEFYVTILVVTETFKEGKHPKSGQFVLARNRYYWPFSRLEFHSLYLVIHWWFIWKTYLGQPIRQHSLAYTSSSQMLAKIQESLDVITCLSALITWRLEEAHQVSN